MSGVGLHVVLGASGGAGNAIVRALHADHREVRAVSRSGSTDSPDGVQSIAADITTSGGTSLAMGGATVAYMAAQPSYHRWAEEFPQMLNNVIGGCADVGAKLVMVDNLYAYGPGAGIISEETPEAASDNKGLVRRQMTRTLLEAHEKGRLRVAIGRASDYFGPHADNSVITALAIEPAVSGKTMRWAGTMNAPHSVRYLPDIARAYLSLGTNDEADGQVWILPHPEPVTGEQFLAMVNSALKDPVKTATLSVNMLRLASPFHKASKEMLEIRYQWTDPFVVDDSMFTSAFGPFEQTPIEEAVRHTVEWYQDRR